MTKLDVKEVLGKKQRNKLKKCSHPDWLAPMLARLHHDHFSAAGWIYERKLDGERCLLFRHNKKVRLLSRNKKELGIVYPELQEAAAEQEADDFVADGEIVAFSGRTTSFSRLQKRMHLENRGDVLKSRVAVYLYLFDLLYLDGYDLSNLPLRQRKKLLRRLLDWNDPLRFTPHRNKEGKKFYSEACSRGWEGIMAKEADSRYIHARSGKWLKFKCSRRQEFVIGGYTDPKGSRKGFGALLLGYYKDGELLYAGKVGTGFDNDFLEAFGSRLKKNRRQKSPFGDPVPGTKKVNWVPPRYVGEIGFTEWTGEGRLRHPRFIGLRDDKKAEKVVRER
jgi:bifunctional non-homologous end joining protein LigD